MTDEDESASDWLGIGDTGERATPAKGEVVTKTRLGVITGLAQATIDRAIAEGAPILGKGTRKEGWRINTASFFDWYWRRKVLEATGDPDAGNFEAAKRRDKAAQARMREIQIAKEERQLCETADVIAWVSRMVGTFRSQALALVSQVPDLTPKQREELRRAVHDMLSDLAKPERPDFLPDEDEDEDEDGNDGEPWIAAGESPSEGNQED
jgi:phage terminase Nu1 subunit (DNA packaging protein)